MLGGSLLTTVLAFLGFGLLLSFTPCVFPMIPILSGMLARAGQPPFGDAQLRSVRVLRGGDGCGLRHARDLRGLVG